MSQKSYYEIPGVSRKASDEEIKKAYYKIARVSHPDSHSDERINNLEDAGPTPARVCKKVTLAYDILSGPKLRAKYDETLPPCEGDLKSKGLGPAYGFFGKVAERQAADDEASPEITLYPPHSLRGMIWAARRFINCASRS